MTMPTSAGSSSGDSREGLLSAHVLHEFDERLVADNLRGCYGQVMRRFYLNILPYLKGRRILDAGCGFGLFSYTALSGGCDVVAIDIDECSLKVARNIYGLACHNESVYGTSLQPGARDTVVLMDAVQHLELDKLQLELRRLDVSQIVIYESNEKNRMLSAYRRKVSHSEAHNYSVDDLGNAFKEDGFSVRVLRYENFLSLPCSGGLQRRPLPVIGRFPSLLYFADQVLRVCFRLFCIDRILAFRYLLILEKIHV